MGRCGIGHRINLQDGTGVFGKIGGVGVTLAYGSSAPSNGAVGFAPGCEFRLYSAYSAGAQVYINAGTAASATWYADTAPSGTNTFTSATITTATIPNFAGAESHAGIITPVAGVAPAGGFSATPGGVVHTQGKPCTLSTEGSDLTPAASTTAYVCEIFIPCNMTLTGVKTLNGAAVGSTVQVQLYTSAGVGIAACVTAATTTSGGAGTQQAIAFAAPYAAVGPAKYLLVFQYGATSERPRCHALGTAFGIAQATTTLGATPTAISPLPTAFTATQQPIASLY